MGYRTIKAGPYEGAAYKAEDGITWCVTFVREVTGAPETKKWKQGLKVSVAGPSDILPGTAIATFDDQGKYPTDLKGKHAAIYLSHDQSGIWVLDQYKEVGKVGKRLIRFNVPANTKRSNDGNTFFVIE